MTIPANERIRALTEKERQTLRLIVRGHDAKSIARDLGLSVHTINERLRDARRKLAVSSSREAARLLFEAEDGRPSASLPESSRDEEIGGASASPGADGSEAPASGAGPAFRLSTIAFGVALMTLALGLLAFTVLPQQASAPPQASARAAETADPAVVDAASRFLALLDKRDWGESYRATGASFRRANTLQVWAAASEQARTPLGAMISRDLVGQENLPAPPSGYEVVKFRTRFANRAEAVETVTLDREDGRWRVVGITIG